MKTPKRHTGNPRAVDLYAQRHSRWKRKNRIRQLKHTIKVLTRALRDTEECLTFTQYQTKFFLVYPDHWQPRLKQIRKELDQP